MRGTLIGQIDPATAHAFVSTTSPSPHICTLLSTFADRIGRYDACISSANSYVNDCNMLIRSRLKDDRTHYLKRLPRPLSTDPSIISPKPIKHDYALIDAILSKHPSSRSLAPLRYYQQTLRELDTLRNALLALCDQLASVAVVPIDQLPRTPEIVPHLVAITVSTSRTTWPDELRAAFDQFASIFWPCVGPADIGFARCDTEQRPCILSADAIRFANALFGTDIVIIHRGQGLVGRRIPKLI